jgi:hypothetical protein
MHSYDVDEDSARLDRFPDVALPPPRRRQVRLHDGIKRTRETSKEDLSPIDSYFLIEAEAALEKDNASEVGKFAMMTKLDKRNIIC